MSELTKSLESATRKRIDSWLTELGWNIDEDSFDCNVFTERAKTKEQNQKFKGKKPDFVLYKSGTDDPVAVIEAKRKGQPIEKALQQGIERYAKPLGVDIVFAIDGAFVKTYSIKNEKELTIDNAPLHELISEEKLLRFLKEGTNIEEVTEEVKYTREELIKIFEWADNLLRKEGLQKGVERFTAFSNFLFIKIISEIEDDREKRGVKRLLKKSLCWESFENIEDEETLLNYINNTVLKDGLAKEYNHSDDIFQEKLKIRNPKTVKEIVNKLSKLKLINTESEIKGDAFEYFIKSIASSNDLGEYFTPRHIVKIMVHLINPKFGSKILDPFCGTGGFLIEAFRHIRKGIDERDENLMATLKNYTLFGVELTETYKIAKMNMIITGDGHNNIIQDDTAKNTFWEKFSEGEQDKEKVKKIEKIKETGFDYIISNIPYNQKTDYGNLYPVPSNNGDSVFIQNIINALAKKGKVAVIVPEGLIFRKLYEKTRQWILENANIISVISLPRGVFLPYANVKTAIFVFDGKQRTERVWFYRLNNDGFELNTNRRPAKENDIPDLLNKWDEKPESENSFWVDFEDIQSKNYSLNIDDYVKRQKDKSEHPLVEIANVCKEIKSGGTPPRNKVEYFRNGNNLWVTIGDMKQKYITNTKEKITNEAIENSNVKKLPKGTVLISIFATLGEVAILQKEATTNQAISGLVVDDAKIDNEYLYYVLKNKKEYIESLGRGIAQKNINQSILKKIKIPLPSLVEQRKIVDRLQKEDLEIQKMKQKIADIESGKKELLNRI
jgi:type I restriction enzyme M protein